jgi:hypothetical protein
MAIAPNTTFVSGAILTAAQQNAFGFGIVALASLNSSTTVTTTEAVQLTSTTFTAIANRYYKITYIENTLSFGASLPGFVTQRIRITGLAGTIYQSCYIEPVLITSDGQNATISVVTTLPAGSTVIVGTSQTSTNTATLYGATGFTRQILVEDIGPA